MKHRPCTGWLRTIWPALLLVLCLLMSCNRTENPSTDDTDIPTQSETDTEKETGDTSETKTETETTSESESESESETEIEPHGSPTEILFDGGMDLSFLKTAGCSFEWYEDAERGTVLKVQTSSRMNHVTLDYEGYMTAMGLSPIDITNYQFAMITFKTGTGYGETHTSSAMTFHGAAGDTSSCRVADGLEATYSPSSTDWQTVTINLSAGKWSGTLHNLLFTAAFGTRTEESYCVASISFASSMADLIKALEGDDFMKGIEMELTESTITGVNLDKRTAPDEDPSVSFWFDHTTERKAQNDTTATDMASYLIRMPGNSIEGCQFFLSPGQTDRTFTLSLSDFTNEAGHALRTELFYERYYLVEDTMIPDALPPLTGEITVSAGLSQGFYIKVWADTDEPAGLYTAELQVMDAATGKVIKVATVYTYVWDFSLSDETAMKTAVGLNDYTVYLTYENRGMTEKDYTEIWKTYYDFLLENRLCSYNLPYKLVDGRVWDYLNNPRVTTFKIRDDAATAYSILEAHPDLQKKAYFYIVDEPTNMTLLNKLKENAEGLETTYPGYRMISPFFTNISVSNGDDQIEFMKNYLSIWNTKIFAFTPRKYASLPGVQYLMNETQEEKYGCFEDRMAEEVAGGDDLWVYFCWEPSEPYVNWLLTGDGTEPLVSVWQCRNTKCTGILYWEVSYWSENLKTTPAGVDVWGDGVLLHSGAEYGIYEPVSSLRLENIRNGIQDYQMLSMVEEMAGAEAADELTSLVSVNVLAYTTDDAHLHAARVLLGETVESLTKD